MVELESTQSMLCPACGHDNIPGSDACEDCGQNLAQTHGEGVEAEQADASIFQLPLSRLNPRKAECVPRRATISEAIALLKSRRLGCVLVTGEEEELAGIFTEGDVHYKVAGLIENLDSIPVESLMTPRPSTLRPGDPISRALHLMGLHGFRHIPLVDDSGRPVSIISFRDIVRFMEDSFTAS